VAWGNAIVWGTTLDINEKAGLMAYFSNDFRHLDDLYVSALDGNGQRQLTRLNTALWSELDLGETIIGTPSISHGGLYVRSDGHLWKITEP